MIAKSWFGRCWQWQIGGCVAIFGVLCVGVSDRINAQIVPDNTLGVEGSVVTPDVIKGIQGDRIDGGATRDANLFHSFSQFNIGEGRGAYFTNPAGIENILSRVTGANRSEILGRLGVLGNANLFLINPNGIVFGPNASLDVQGSFLATTADAVKLGDTGLFSASQAATSNLLTVSPSALWFNAVGAQPIVNQSQAQSLSNHPNVNGDPPGLQVRPGRTLALVGGDVRLEGGNLTAAGGRIELGSVAGEGTVGLVANGSELALIFPNGVARGNVSMTNSGVDVTGNGGGSIAINARNLTMMGSYLSAGIESGRGSIDAKAGDVEINATEAINLDESNIANRVDKRAVGSAGDINIKSGSLSFNRSRLEDSTSGQGNAGSVFVQAAQNISLIESSIVTSVYQGAVGKGGDINIKSGSLSLSNGAQLASYTSGQGNAGKVSIDVRDATTFAGTDSGVFTIVNTSTTQGNGGDINITTGSLALTDGAILATSTNGRGDAGSVSVQAAQTISLVDSVIRTSVDEGAVGKGGDINIKSGSLFVSNSAQLQSYTSGQGNAGQVSIDVRDATTFAGTNSGVATVVYTPTTQGNGGDINITTGSLALTDGAGLVTSTQGRGDAGSVSVQAAQNISLVDSLIRTSVEKGAVGNAGDINITTGSLALTDVAALVTYTQGRGDAGSVFVQAAQTISLIDSAVIRTSVDEGAVGKGGDINIKSGSLSVTNGAQLLSFTSGQGNAGQVSIDVRDATTFAGTDSWVVTIVDKGAVGNAGDINITTGSLALTDSAVLATSTNGTGDAGSVSVQAAQTISLIESSIVTAVNQGAVGKGGDINIKSGSLFVTNGAQLQSFTSGQGNAGQVSIDVRDATTFAGTDSAGVPSGVFTIVNTSTTQGNGGDINITTGSLALTDGAVLATSTNGQGTGGNVTINTGNLTARNGTIVTSSNSEQFSAGGITITASKIRLFGNSDITTRVNFGVGDSGDIDLKADSILAFDDSDILAYAENGRGGDINLKTPAFFGENYRPAPRNTKPDTLDGNDRADVNADSNINPGNITRPDTTFIQNSLTELPENQIDTDSLLANSCIVRRNQPTQGSFTITGSGGLPQRPGDVQMSTFPTVDIETLPGDSTPSTTKPKRPWQKGDPIVEPQGVYRLPNGKLVLSRECS